MKNYCLKTILLISALLFTQLLFSQKPKQTGGNSMWASKDLNLINKALNKKLYVSLFDISKKEEKRLKRKKLYDEVVEENKIWNAFLKKMITEEYPEYKNVNYIYTSEYDKFIKERHKNALLLSFVYTTDEFKSGNFIKDYSYKRLKLIDVENKKVIAWINLFREEPLNLEYKTILIAFKEYIQYIREGEEAKYFENVLNQEGTKEIRKTTLLIPEESTGLTKSEIKELYPFPFKILNYDGINKIIENNKTGYAVITANRLSKKNRKYTYRITNIESKKTLLMIYKSSVPFFNTKKTEQTIERLYTKSQFKDFTKIILNNRPSLNKTIEAPKLE